MDDVTVGRVVRALRHRVRWRQRDLSEASGVSQQFVAALEAGRLDGMRIGTVRGVVAPLSLRLTFDARWRGGELSRLLDAGHARLQDLFKRRLEAAGWLVVVEFTYSRYGERGSIDLLAFDQPSGILLVIEIKTELTDLQALFRGLHAKTRLARTLVAELGWRPTATIPCLVVQEGTTARHRVADYASLFAALDLRGHALRRWLPAPRIGPRGLLGLLKLPSTRTGGTKRVRRPRARVRVADSSVAQPTDEPESPSIHAYHHPQA